ncbi:condensin-2 complex subunit G2-like [Tachypleus tridentatus]|uniref:condensin-2 complex subunit G2-like n=1 Tax=Tachypleus tridentatus TaxID=6853 RepID=UPI003FD0DF57
MAKALSPRETLLDAVKHNDPDEVLELMLKHNSKKSYFDLKEVFSSLNKAQLDTVWKNLFSLCESHICTALTAGTEEDGDEFAICPPEEGQKALKLLSAVVAMAKLTIRSVTTGDRNIPDNLVQTAVLLHGLIVGFPDSQDGLRNNIAQLCELWWSNDLEAKEHLGTNTIIYLLQRTLLHNKNTKSDVKRVWAMRNSLLEVLKIEENESTNIFWELLLQCSSSFLYLSIEEGRKFLSFLFHLNIKFIETIHKAIKNQLPNCSLNQAEMYGKVYFRAWLNSTGNYREKIEQFCIQDFMFYAVHVPRNIKKSLAPLLRRLLNCFHRQKQQRSVAIMLLNLYEPIIWRSLKVANGHVRANAATIFFDVFPLEDPEANVEEADVMLQKQFDVIHDLLADPFPLVRTIASYGVCGVLCHHFEMIPNQVIQAFLKKLVEDLAHDVTSAEVRSSVFKGFSLLMENPLTHPTMKVILPKLQDTLFDISDKVRVAFCDLLLKVKGLRSIKFWHVVPVDYILASMETSSLSVARRLVKLVQYSFLPENRPGLVQLERCVTLIESNRNASRVFFQCLNEQLGIETIVDFMLLVNKALYAYVKRKTKTIPNDSSELSIEGNTLYTENKENHDDVLQNCDSLHGSKNEDEFPFDDPEIVCGFIDAICILWHGTGSKLQQAAYSEKLKQLVKAFTASVTIFLVFFKDGQVWDSLVYLTSFLPPSSVPTFAGCCMSRLRSLAEDSEPKSYHTILESLCNHGRGSDVLELVSEWLTFGLNRDISRKKSKRATRKVKFVDPHPSKPLLGVHFLSYMLHHPVCRGILLQNHGLLLMELQAILQSIQGLIQQKVVSESKEELNSTFYIEAFTVFCELTVVLHHHEKCGDFSAISVMEQLLDWTTKELLPVLNRKQALPKQSKSTNSKSFTETRESYSLILQVLEVLLSVAGDMLLINIADEDFCSCLADFCLCCVQTAKDHQILPLVLRITQQAVEFLHLQCELEGKSVQESWVPSLVGKVLQIMANKGREDSQIIEKEITEIKPVLADILLIYCGSSTVGHDTLSDVISTFMAAMLAEITLAINKHQGFEMCSKVEELPSLSGVLLSVIVAKSISFRLFLKALTDCLQSDAILGMAGCLATVHLLHILAVDDSLLITSLMPELKTAIHEAEALVQRIGITVKSGDPNESITTSLDRSYTQSAMDILKIVKEKLRIL